VGCPIGGGFYGLTRFVLSDGVNLCPSFVIVGLMCSAGTYGERLYSSKKDDGKEDDIVVVEDDGNDKSLVSKTCNILAPSVV
jgi:hypothetical protein